MVGYDENRVVVVDHGVEVFEIVHRLTIMVAAAMMSVAIAKQSVVFENFLVVPVRVSVLVRALVSELNPETNVGLVDFLIMMMIKMMMIKMMMMMMIEPQQNYH